MTVQLLLFHYVIFFTLSHSIICYFLHCQLFSCSVALSFNRSKLYSFCSESYSMTWPENSEDEVKRAVDRSRNGEAPGCDIIPNEIYKTWNKATIYRLTILFNKPTAQEGYLNNGARQKYVQCTNRKETIWNMRTTVAYRWCAMLPNYMNLY